MLLKRNRVPTAVYEPRGTSLVSLTRGTDMKTVLWSKVHRVTHYRISLRQPARVS